MNAKEKKHQVGSGFLVGLPTGLAGALRRLSPGPALETINQSPVRLIVPKRGYRWHAGFFAWLLHRLAGAALAGYLILHLYVLSRLAEGPEAFDGVMNMFDHPIIRLLEIGLLGVVAYHTINGLRIVLMDYGPLAGRETHVKYVAGTFIVIAAVIAIGGLSMLLHIIGL